MRNRRILIVTLLLTAGSVALLSGLPIRAQANNTNAGPVFSNAATGLIPSAFPTATLKALWVYSDELTDPANRQQLVQRSAANGVTDLYLSVYSSTANSAGRLMYDDAAIADLITQATSQSINVWAAYGAPDWPVLGCDTAAFPMLRMADVITYNNANPTARFNGVALDVEPPEPQTEANFQALLPLYQCINTRLQSSGLQLAVAIRSFWDKTVVFPGGTGKDLTPKKLLIYYGYPSALNATYTVQGAAAELGKYDYVVLGDGLEKADHGDHQNTVDIIKNPAMSNTSVFGYIDLGVTPSPRQNLNMTEVISRVDEWKATGAKGIFFDDYGYDWGTTRDRQNAAVDYAHSQGMALVANGFAPDDVFGNANPTTCPVPNSTTTIACNPLLTPTHLTSTDFYLYESHQIRLGSYEAASDWQTKATTLKAYQDAIHFKIFSITTNDVPNTYDENKFFYAWYSALMYGHEATGWGELYFAAGNASSPFRARPAVDGGTAFSSSVFMAGTTFTRTTTQGQVSVDTAAHTAGFSLMSDQKPAYQRIIDLNPNRVVVMGYRDYAGTGNCSGGDGIICLDQAAIAYAGGINNTTIIQAGVETSNCVPACGPANVTFYQDGRSVFDTELQLVGNYFMANAKYGGMAIHRYNNAYLSGTPKWPIITFTQRYVGAGTDMGNNCGSSSSPCATLQYAVDQANAGDIIYVAAGTYTSPAGSEVLSLTKNLALYGGWDPTFSAQSGASIIDAQNIGGQRGVTIVSATVVLDSFSIQNGNRDVGGGIYSDGGSNGGLTLINSVVATNTATNNGGGVYIAAGSFVQNRSSIQNNSAANGGGLFIDQGSATLSYGQVISNRAGGGGCGGGVYVLGASGAFTQSGGLISGNTAADGGGLCVGNGTSILSGGQIAGNTAANIGGGVYVWNPAARFIQTGGSIERNRANYGSGLFVFAGASTLSGGQIANNTATNDGGGAYVVGGSLTVSGAQILSNTASLGGGGGAYISQASATFLQTSGSIEHNTAINGGGLYVADGSATLGGGLIGSNTATNNGGGGYLWHPGATLVQPGGVIGSNTAGADGGGLYAGDGSAKLNGGQIINNTAVRGAGVFVNTGSFALSDGLIEGNTASVQGGGVLLLGTTSAFTQTWGIIGYNHAAQRGGGLFVDAGGASLVAGQIRNNSTDGLGGGVFINSGAVALSDVEITSNTTSNHGGGVYVATPNAVFTQTDGTIEFNSANFGGGLFVYQGTATLSGGRVATNTATMNGGGIYLTSGSVSLSVDGQIISNTASSGGGVFVEQSTARFTQTGGIVGGNSASANGGGLYVGAGTAALNAGQVALNMATDGGGLYVSDGLAALSGGQIISNTATHIGGGVYVLNPSAAFLQTNGTLERNSAGLEAGGLYLQWGHATLSGGQISANMSGNGAGLFIASGGAILSGGQIISNTASASGGGVYMLVADGAFTQTSGTIGGNVALNGGGLYMNRGTATLSGGQISGNSASIYGGGAQVAGGSLALNGGQIASNTATTNGGGIFLTSGNVTLNSGAKIISNTADSGGGVFVDQTTGTFTQTGGSIEHNNASANGGGLLVKWGQALLSGGQIATNTAAATGGGVFLETSSAAFTQTGGTIERNAAGYSGGGMYVGNGPATLSGGQIVSNTAVIGGGLWVANGAVTLSGGLIGANRASVYGGGVYVALAAGTFMQTAGTIGSNSATYGGGLYIANGLVTLSGGQISGNTATTGGGVFVDSSALLRSNNSVSVADTVINHGTLQVQSGTFTLNSLANLSSATLSEGTFLISDTLSLPGVINTNATTIVLDSALAHITTGASNALANLTTNNGDFSLLNGSSVSLTMLTNTSNVTIGVSSILTASADYTQTTGGMTVLISGTLSTTGNCMRFQGVVKGNGKLYGCVVNSGTVSPGFSPGTINIFGDYTQTSAGVLIMEVAGTGAGQFDQLNVTGMVHLGGTLNVTAINSFVPVAGTTFPLLNYAASSGSFAVVNADPNQFRNTVGPTGTTSFGVVDLTPPTTTVSLSAPPSAGGWYSSAVTVTFIAVDDGGSGVRDITLSASGAQPMTALSTAAISASLTITREGITSISYSARDNAGNVEPLRTLTIKVDRSAPGIGTQLSPAPNTNGWNNSNVTVSFQCVDALSGIAACSAPSVLATEGAQQTVTGTARDNAGNVTTLPVYINLDKTPPATGSNVITSGVRATVTLAANDTLSGIASTVYSVNGGATQSYVGPFNLNGIGSYVILYSSADRAGNSEASKTLNLRIVDPCTTPGVLDAFNRASGNLGRNWSGFTDPSFYRIVTNSVWIGYGGPIYWTTAFSVNQAAFVTLNKLNAGSREQGVLLKVQTGHPSQVGGIAVVYDAAAHAVRVETYLPGASSATLYTNTPATFVNGDKLGGCALANGTVNIYQNDVLISTIPLNAADQAFFNTRGGNLGLWFINAASAVVDDFGGGTITP